MLIDPLGGMSVRKAIALAIECLPGHPLQWVSLDDSDEERSHQETAMRAHVLGFVRDYARSRGVILEDEDITVELDAMIGELRDGLPLTGDPMLRFIKKLEEFNDSVDIGLRKLLPVVGKPIACGSCTKPGCCSQRVSIDFHEALPIAKVLVESGRSTPEFRAKLSALGEEMEGTSNDAWLAQARPCMFLDESNRCSIYQVRPMVCRLYHVVSDPAHCDPISGDDDKTESVDTSHLKRIVASHSRTAHFELGLKETPQRWLVGMLPRVLAIALDALDADRQEDFQARVRNKIWPSTNDLQSGWMDGNNPFAVKVSVDS